VAALAARDSASKTRVNALTARQRGDDTRLYGREKDGWFDMPAITLRLNAPGAAV
jgi:hypothetical protein